MVSHLKYSLNTHKSKVKEQKTGYKNPAFSSKIPLSRVVEIRNEKTQQKLGIRVKPILNCLGGEEGIRTLEPAKSQVNGLANRRLQPLGHLSTI